MAMDHKNLYYHTALQVVLLTRNKSRTVLSREIAGLPFVSLLVKVSIHSSTMVHVLLQSLIDQTKRKC